MTAKYMVTSGFLGSGKTTSMIAFADSINSRGLGSAAILANDLGAGNIVDAEFTATTGIKTLPISGNCICYQHENLVDKLHQLEAAGADIIFSDIPGCGIGALDHVYLELDDKEKGQFTLMPFMCIVDPERIKMIMPQGEDINLPEEMKFLLDAQMAEADIIVLNKIDTISDAEADNIIGFIKENYPAVPVMAISALKGTGVDNVVDYILSSKAAAVHKEIGYGSDAFVAAESRLSWFNTRIFMEQREDKNIDFNDVISDIFEEIRKGLISKKSNVPHLKMFAADDAENMTDFFKASLIGVDYDVEYSRKLDKKYSALSLVINARAAADSQDMSDIVNDALDSVSVKYNLKIKTFFMETFGMMEEGRGNTGRASRYE